MSLEQNICVCHLLLMSSFVKKEWKSLGSLITSRLGYMIVGNPVVYLKNSLQANGMKRNGSLILSLSF